MQLHPSGGLTSVLAALFSGVNAASIGVAGSPALEFEQILTQLSAVFDNPGQGRFHSAALRMPPDTGGLDRWMGGLDIEEDGNFLENLKALRERLEVALQSLRAEAAEAQLPSDTLWLDRWMGGLDIEEDGNFLENLKALRERLETTLSTRTPAERNLFAGREEEKSAALQLAEAVSQLSQQHQPEIQVPGAVEPSKMDEVVTVEGFQPVGQQIHAIAAQVAEEVRAIIAAVEAQLSPSVPDSAVKQDTHVPLTSTNQKPEPVPLVVLRLNDLAAEAEVAKPAETEVVVKSGSMPETDLSGGSSQPDFQAPGPGSDPKRYGIELPPLTLGKVVGPSFTPSPMLQGSDKPVMALHQPLGHPAWADELGQRLIWMHGKSIQAAEIHINPPQLGPVAVRIQVHDDQTSIQFTSPHAAVREAIEAALPRLRELFEARQLPLTQVEVAQQSLEDRSHSHARQQSHASAQDYQVNAREEGLEESRQENEQLKVNIGSRLLSLYA